MFSSQEPLSLIVAAEFYTAAAVKADMRAAIRKLATMLASGGIWLSFSARCHWSVLGHAAGADTATACPIRPGRPSAGADVNHQQRQRAPVSKFDSGWIEFRPTKAGD
ncbi:hypothetical protein [Mesorhizobium sp. f-mel]